MTTDTLPALEDMQAIPDSLTAPLETITAPAPPNVEAFAAVEVPAHNEAPTPESPAERSLLDLLYDTVREQQSAHASETQRYGEILRRALTPEAGDAAELLRLAEKLGKSPDMVHAEVQAMVVTHRATRREEEADWRVRELDEQRAKLQHQVDSLRATVDAGVDLHAMQRLNFCLLTFAIHHSRSEFRTIAECALRASGWRLTDNIGTWARRESDGTERKEIAIAALKRQVLDDLRSPAGLAMLDVLASAPMLAGGKKTLALDPATLRPNDLR